MRDSSTHTTPNERTPVRVQRCQRDTAVSRYADRGSYGADTAPSLHPHPAPRAFGKDDPVLAEPSGDGEPDPAGLLGIDDPE